MQLFSPDGKESDMHAFIDALRTDSIKTLPNSNMYKVGYEGQTPSHKNYGRSILFYRMVSA